MRYTRAERAGQAVVVTIALVFGLVVIGFVFRSGPPALPLPGNPAASTSPAAGPVVTFVHDTCCAQTARAVTVDANTAMTSAPTLEIEAMNEERL